MVARMVPPPMGFLAPYRHCDVSVWRWGSPLFRPQRALLAPPVHSRGSRGILTAVGVTGRLSHRIWGSLPIQDGRVVNGADDSSPRTSMGNQQLDVAPPQRSAPLYSNTCSI